MIRVRMVEAARAALLVGVVAQLVVQDAHAQVRPAAQPTAAAAPAAAPVAIVGGRVYPVSGPMIENATVIIRDGKIAAVGANIPIPADAQRVDAAGKWVTPGLINSESQLGLTEIGAVPETNEGSAEGREEISAAFRVWEGFNPASVLLAPARNEGVTSVLIVPGGGLVAGQAAVVDLSGQTMVDMLRRGPVAMIAQVGSSAAAGTGARGELMMRLRELLDETRAYGTRTARGAQRPDPTAFEVSRTDLAAMGPVLSGQLPLIIGADMASDIDAALRLAAEYRLRIMISGGAEAWKVADRLAAANVPVLTGALNNIPGGFSTLGARQENAALLRRAGVNVLLVGAGGEAFNVRNIRQEAGNAVSYGMSWDDALRSVTLAPAEAFGVAGQIGTLQAGRDANLVIWSGDPFEFSTRAERVYIRGVDVSGPSRQDMLIERYKTLPPNYGPPPND
jgi:imidazolonepropionase-like amidohydrolase